MTTPAMSQNYIHSPLASWKNPTTAALLQLPFFGVLSLF